MVKNKKMLITFAIFFFIFGATAIKSQLDKKASRERSEAALSAAKTDTLMQSLMHEEYPNVPESNNFIRETSDEIISRFDEGTGVIFLGFKECPWCQKAAPLLQQAAESEKVPIYYLDIRQERESESPAYQEILSILTPYLPVDTDGTVRVSTPDISFVRNGEIIWRYKLERSEGENTPDTYWANERQARDVEQFKNQMRKL